MNHDCGRTYKLRKRVCIFRLRLGLPGRITLLGGDTGLGASDGDADCSAASFLFKSDWSTWGIYSQGLVFFNENHFKTFLHYKYYSLIV
jgi:hypothetical protein